MFQIGTMEWCCLNTIQQHKNIPTIIRKTILKPLPKSQQYAWENLTHMIMHLGWISDLQKLGWVVNSSQWDKPHLFCNTNQKLEVNHQMYDSTSMRGHVMHHAHIYEIMTFQISLIFTNASWGLLYNLDSTSEL
jgi:hypothetical protein